MTSTLSPTSQSNTRYGHLDSFSFFFIRNFTIVIELMLHCFVFSLQSNCATALVLSQKYPPHSHLVRAVSILTGYFIKPTGPNSCTFIYLSQADPKGEDTNEQFVWRTWHFSVFLKSLHVSSLGSLPKWVVNKASQVLAPRVGVITNKRQSFSYKGVQSTWTRCEHVSAVRGTENVYNWCVDTRECGFHASWKDNCYHRNTCEEPVPSSVPADKGESQFM